jgi:peptidoglycan/xylan/chitin deacetylase (PgdA/CDA1 family)
LKKSFFTFLYHEVTDIYTDTGFQRKSNLPYKHGIDEFYKNIDIIVDNCDDIITLNDLAANSSGTLLTFDDGGKSAIRIADYLEQHSLRGHFFITTGMIGQKCFLDKNEIIDLYERGHIIGSHSHSHPNVFRALKYKEMIEEWSESKKILESILQTKIDSCSVPGGDANRATYKAANECGYKYVFNSEPDLRVLSYKNTLILGRFCPLSGTSMMEIESLCKHKNLWKYKLVRKFKSVVKIALSPVYYYIIAKRGI